ncbi:zinc finger, CCHC-type containing protein [Tanacetum coccineum]
MIIHNLTLPWKYGGEESLRAQDSDKGKGKEVDGPFVNMTEDGKNKNNKQNKGKKRGFKKNNSGSSSNKCGKTGHFKRDCRSGRVDAIAWWIDSGDTTHVCKDHCWFKTYEPVEDGFVLYMGDDYFTPVHGKGSVVLKFSLGKSNTVVNVLTISLQDDVTRELVTMFPTSKTKKNDENEVQCSLRISLKIYLNTPALFLQLVDERNAEDDIEVFSTEPGFDWIFAHKLPRQ